jgi:predicted ATPase
MAALEEKVRNGILRPDSEQIRGVRRLERLHAALVNYDNSPILIQRCDEDNREERLQRQRDEGESSGNNLDRDMLDEGKPPALPATVPHLPRIPRGIYLHGNVGVGKSLLMDLFFEVAPVERKQRHHFHAFVSAVHGRIHDLKRQDLETRGRSFQVDTRRHRNPVHRVGVQLAKEMSLLCLDEFQGTETLAPISSTLVR